MTRNFKIAAAQSILLVAALAIGGDRQGGPVSVSQPPLPEDLRSEPVRSQLGMVVCNAPEAARVGAEILEAGGNAVDAAVAAAFALGVAEPGAAGLGGQAVILIRLASGRAVAIDGSTFTPRGVSNEALRDTDQLDRNWGPETISVPTTPAVLDLALKRYGTMSLDRILAPAIELAEHGVALTPTQLAFIESYMDAMVESEFLTSKFLRHGIEFFEPERVFCQPEQARTLRRLAQAGIEDFYRGEIAELIEEEMIAVGAAVRRDDLARVRPIELMPNVAKFRDVEVLSFPQPGGGEAVTGALSIINEFPPDLLRSSSPDAAHLLVEAVRLAQAELLFLGGGSPLPGFLASRSQSRWARKVRFDRFLQRHEITDSAAHEFWSDSTTTQLSVIDRDGNAVSATITLGKNFGSFVAGPQLGIAWNSLLGSQRRNGYVERPLPRPWQPIRHLMAPTIVVKDGRPFLILGSQSSGRITGSLVQTIVNVVDLDLPLSQAVSRPRVVWDGRIDGRACIEMAPPNDENLGEIMLERGLNDVFLLHFPARPIDLCALGGVNAIMVDPESGEFIGVGDPRRYAAARAPDPENMRSPTE